MTYTLFPKGDGARRSLFPSTRRNFSETFHVANACLGRMAKVACGPVAELRIFPKRPLNTLAILEAADHRCSMSYEKHAPVLLAIRAAAPDLVECH